MYHHESEEIYKLLNYDAILFDVDGTLIDSAPGIINTLKEVFAKMGVDTTNVNLRRYLGPPLRKSFGEHFTDPALIEKATDLYRDSYAVKGSHECAAYPLSRKDLFGRNIFISLFIFTMFFNGGMIPTYMVIKGLHMLDTRLSLIHI